MTSCGKLFYASRREAKATAKARARHGAGKLRAYPCTNCGGWHLTKLAKFRQEHGRGSVSP